MKVYIRRLETSNQGTFGILTCGDFQCFTGELPWKDNKSNISCIPTGTYTAICSISNKLGKMTYILQNVPARESIRIHSANLMGDKQAGFKCQLNGCIALGQRIGTIDGQKALLLSKPAIRQFEELLNKEPFILEIE